MGQYEVKNMFKNAETLWDIHNLLLKRLQEEELKPVKEQQIGNIFIDMQDKFEEYNTYCANQQTSTETAEKMLKDNAKFREYVEEIKTFPECNRQEFNSYLLKPFQRICRYELLLKVSFTKNIFKKKPKSL